MVPVGSAAMRSRGGGGDGEARIRLSHKSDSTQRYYLRLVVMILPADPLPIDLIG